MKQQNPIIPIQFFRLSRPSMDYLLKVSRKYRREYIYMDGTKKVVEHDDNEKGYWEHVERLFKEVEKVNDVENKTYKAYHSLKTDNGEDAKYWIILNAIYLFYNVSKQTIIDFRSFDINKIFNFSSCEADAKSFILPLAYEMLVIQPGSNQFEKVFKKIEAEFSECLYTKEFPTLEDFVEFEEGRGVFYSHSISYHDFIPTYKQFLSIDRHSDDSPIESWEAFTEGFNKSCISLIMDLLNSKDECQKVYDEIGMELSELINEYRMMGKPVQSIAKASSMMARILEERQFNNKMIKRHHKFLNEISDNPGMYIPKQYKKVIENLLPKAKHSFIKPFINKDNIVESIRTDIKSVCERYECIDRKKREILTNVFASYKDKLERLPIHPEYMETFGDLLSISPPSYSTFKEIFDSKYNFARTK